MQKNETKTAAAVRRLLTLVWCGSIVLSHVVLPPLASAEGAANREMSNSESKNSPCRADFSVDLKKPDLLAAVLEDAAGKESVFAYPAGTRTALRAVSPRTAAPDYSQTPKQFPLNYFKPTKYIPAIPTVPFTADEFTKAAAAKITFGANLQPMVSIRKHRKIDNVDSYENVKVPLGKFVEELNQYEAFLNKYGATLRDGKLNKKDPNDATVQKDLGVLFALRDRNESEPNYVRKVNPIIYNPDKFSRYEPHSPTKGQPGVLVTKTNPGNILNNPKDINLKNAAVINRRVNVQAGRNIGNGIKLRGESNYPRVMKGSTDSTGFVTVNEDSGCGGGKKGPTTIQCFESSCGSPNNHPACEAMCIGKPKNSQESKTADICPELGKQESDPACLYDGEIKPITIPAMLNGFDSTGGGNGWFGGYASLDLIAKIQQNGTQIGMNNAGIALAGIELFGSKIDLLEASNYTSFETGVDSAPQVTVKATALPGMFDVDLQTEYKKTIPGPGTMFLVGPLPISITSEFNAFVGLDKTPQPFQKLPAACNINQNGKMTMFLGPRASADVTVRAALDAFVASAGIEGQLILINDTFGGYLTTEIAPAGNTVSITPKLSYKFQHLAGKINLFVELDLLVYTKKWSIEIINFDGFVEQETLSPKTYTLSAKKKKA